MQAGIIWYRLANPSHKQTPLLQLSVLTAIEGIICACVRITVQCCVYFCVIDIISDYATVCFLTERVIPHKLFTPLLTGMVVTGVILSLILVVLLYKYMQVRQEVNHRLGYFYSNDETVLSE